MFGLSMGTSLSIFMGIVIVGIIAIYQKLSDIDKRLYYIFKVADAISRRQAGLVDDD